MPAASTDTVIDSRDLIERLAELEAIERSLDPAQDADASGEGTLTDDEREELDAIRALVDEGIEDWEYGAALIRDDYFEEHAQQLAEDIGAVDPDASWPLSYIDWERAADALKQDYMAVEYLGQTYWVR